MAWLDDNPNPYKKQQHIGRREEVSGVFVVHAAENTPDFVAFDGGAEAVRDFIGSRKDYGSYHHLADSDSRVQMVEWWNEAFHDATDHGNWHEIGGSIATRADVWPLAPKEWRDGAIDNLAEGFADAARWLKNERGIIVPARLISRAESQARIPGFISHMRRDPKRRSDPWPEASLDLWSQLFDRYEYHAADVLGISTVPGTTPPQEEEDMATALAYRERAGDDRVWIIDPGQRTRWHSDRRTLDNLVVGNGIANCPRVDRKAGWNPPTADLAWLQAQFTVIKAPGEGA